MKGESAVLLACHSTIFFTVITSTPLRPHLHAPSSTHLHSRNTPRRHPAWNELTIVAEDTYPHVTCRYCSVSLSRCQPSRNWLQHLASCHALSKAERIRRGHHGEPTMKPRWKRQKRKKARSPRSPASTQDSVQTEVSLSQNVPATPFAGVFGSAEKDRFQAEIARGFCVAGLPFHSIEVPRIRRALTIRQRDMEKFCRIGRH